MSEQYPQQQPGAVLDIRPGFFPLAFFLFFCKPAWSINGSQPMRGSWKQNTVPVPPGRYEVSIWVPYLFWSQMGRSSIVVDVPAGSAAVVTWYAPFTVFSAGKIRVQGVFPLGGGSAPAQQSQAPYGQQPVQQPVQQQPYGQASAQQQPYAQQPAQQPAQQQPAQPAAQSAGAWHPDPSGRHQQRYWDGARWTEHVADNGVTGSDPIG